MTFGEPMGQRWEQVGELALAFVLSALIGLEREIRQIVSGSASSAAVLFCAARCSARVDNGGERLVDGSGGHGMRCGTADSGAVHGGGKLPDHLRVSSGRA